MKVAFSEAIDVPSAEFKCAVELFRGQESRSADDDPELVLQLLDVDVRVES